MLMRDMPFLRRTVWRAARRAYCAARSDLPDDDISRNGEGRLQQDVVRLLAARQQPAVVFDVGANIGTWSLSFLDARRALPSPFPLKLHAFEPVPGTHVSLLGGLASHPDGACVTPVPMALSSRDGIANIYSAGANQGTNSLHDDGLRPGRETLSIRLTTASAYAASQGIDEIHLLKSDAEGHDCEVIKGAHDLLRMGRIWVLQFEYNHIWIASRHFLKDVFDLIAGTNYSLGKITASRIELLPAWHPELERFFAANFVLIRNDILRELSHLRLAADASNTFA
jgi:FkbM family methyltransferase